MTGLSTHVLDLTSGRPAADVAVRLYHLASYADPRLAASARTDADGRARLVDLGQLTPGSYRIAFEIGAYFARAGAAVSEPPFLGVVVVDFAIADAVRHHHVPLLVSPYGYSTYRGS